MLSNLYLKLFPKNRKTGMTEYLLKQNKKKLVGAELGVKYGGNAFSILKYLDIEKLYLVDHYSKYVECGKTLDFSHAYPIAVKKLRCYKDKIQFIKKDVNDAVSDIDEKLDFVYMDANGEYDIVYSFLVNYYPIVKKGGIIGGKRFNSNWFELCDAVTDFAKENNLKRYGCNSGDWWFVKNETSEE